MKFALFGMPVVIRPMFWIVAIMLGAPGGTSPREIAGLALWIALLFVSILVHELGHAVAMRAYGHTPSIELWGLGGLTHWGPDANVTPGKDIIVSLAGPIAGLVLGSIVFVIDLVVRPQPGTFASELVRQALWVNVIWGFANLLPILPLDGGRVLESAAGWISGDRGRRAAYAISLALAVAVTGFALWRGMYWAAFLAVWCVSFSYQKLSSKPEPSSTDETIDRAKTEAWRQLILGRADEAARICTELLTAVGSTKERDDVLEILAWCGIEAGDEKAALDARRQMSRAPDELLAARLLISDGKLADGLPRLEHLANSRRDSFPALVLSSVYVQEDRADLSLAFLRSERGAGLSSGSHVAISAQLFHAGKFEIAFQACALGFEKFQDARHAYNAACSLTKLGRLDEALEWLLRAIKAGFDDREALANDSDLDELRKHPRWSVIVR